MCTIPEIKGIIYRLTSQTENKSYIGQAVSHLKKYKNGKMYYSKHGAEGRFSNHITQSQNGFNSPIHQAIRKFGKDDFTITILDTCNIENLDEKEQAFIHAFNTKIPNGYNVQSGGECYKHMSVKIQEFMKMQLTKIELKSVNKNKIPNIVRIYIENADKKKFRINFSACSDKSFEQCIEDARDFINEINTGNILIIDTLSYKYQDKLDKFINKIIDDVSIQESQFPTFLSYKVVIRCENKTTRINFGGKTICEETSLKEAQKFVNLLTTLYQNRSQQQATAIEGVSSSL